MNRSLAAIAFLVSGIFFSLALGGWWLSRTVFTSNESATTTQAILSDPEIHDQFRDLVANFSASYLATDEGQLSDYLDKNILSNKAGAAVSTDIIGRAHRMAVGETDQPVVITGRGLIDIVRDERAADVPDFTMPVQTVGILNWTRIVIGWMIPITAVLGLIALLVGVLMRPDRQDAMRGIGEFLVGTAVSILLIGVLYPTYLIPVIDDSIWTAVAPRLAGASLPLAMVLIVVCAVGGAALILFSPNVGGRRQFSTPLNANRYRNESRGWS